LGGIVANLPAVRAARKANTMSRVHRRLIEPIETEQAITPDGKVQYMSRSGTDSGGSATSLDTISLDRFARDAVL
jgi:hypothetical protein